MSENHRSRTAAPFKVPVAPESAPPVERLAYRRAELPALTGLSDSTIGRAIHRGEFPPADRHIGRMPIWSRATIERWLLSGEGRRP